MNDARQLLNINEYFSVELLIQAHQLVNRPLDVSMRRRINRLDEISEEMFESAVLNIPKETLADILGRVIRETRFAFKKEDKWKSSEIRILTYYLRSFQGDDEAFDYALTLVKAHWKDGLINGLLYCILNHWLELKPRSIEKIRGFILQRLVEYQGKNQRYTELKANYDLLEEAGPLRMALLVAQRGLKLEKSPHLLGTRLSLFSLPYFSEVLLRYVEKTKPKDLNWVGVILDKQKQDRSRKLVIACLVKQADNDGDDEFQQEVSQFAKQILGDISLAASWAPFKGATEEEVGKLREAKTLVNKWFTKKVIEVFFEICVKDRERKEYWLRYVDRIIDFRIVGHHDRKSELQKEPRIAPILPTHFVTTYYRQQATALVLCIKDKVFVEFSIKGWALSVYQHGHPNVKRFDEGVKSIAKLDSLKLSIPNLVERDGPERYVWGRGTVRTGNFNIRNNNGKMSHSGDWQSRLDGWMREKIFLSDASSQTFGSDDDEVFVVEPVTEDIVYTGDVKFSMYSKYLPFDKTCRVVANDEGFHLYFKETMRYTSIRGFYEEETPSGALLLKYQDNGWYGIQHIYKTKGSFVNTATMVCYLKEEDSCLMCKLNKDDMDVIIYSN